MAGSFGLFGRYFKKKAWNKDSLGATGEPSTYTQTFSTADRTIANATVSTDIAAFTDPPSAAEMALLRTFVNALKADAADLRQGLTAVIDDLQSDATVL